jgi:hypothetical protein
MIQIFETILDSLPLICHHLEPKKLHICETVLDTLPSQWHLAEPLFTKFKTALPNIPCSLTTLSGVILYNGPFNIELMLQFINCKFYIINDSNHEYEYVLPSHIYSICLDSIAYENWYELFSKIDWNEKNSIDLTIIFGNVDVVFNASEGFMNVGSAILFYGVENIYDLIKSYYETKYSLYIDTVYVEKDYLTYLYPRELVPSNWKYNKLRDEYTFPN